MDLKISSIQAATPQRGFAHVTRQAWLQAGLRSGPQAGCPRPTTAMRLTYGCCRGGQVGCGVGRSHLCASLGFAEIHLRQQLARRGGAGSWGGQVPNCTVRSLEGLKERRAAGSGRGAARSAGTPGGAGFDHRWGAAAVPRGLRCPSPQDQSAPPPYFF